MGDAFVETISGLVSEQQVDNLLHPCRNATSPESFSSALRELALNLTVPSYDSCTREDVAFRLIYEFGTVIGVELNDLLDKCLDACGSVEMLSASVRILREISSYKKSTSSSKTSATYAFEKSIRTLHRLLFIVPNDKLTAQDVWLNKLAKEEYAFGIDSFLYNLVQTILLLPVQIANACHAMQLNLPNWAIQSRYYSQLVESSFYIAMLNDTNLSMPGTLYWEIIVQQIIRNRSRNEDVAEGMYKYYIHQNLHTPGRPCCQSGKEQRFAHLILKLNQKLSPRDSSTLLRAIIRHFLFTCTRNDGKLLWNSKSLPTYLTLTCTPTLAESRNIRESFVMLTVLSSSSIQATDERMDQHFCRCVADLLAYSSTNYNNDEKNKKMQDNDKDDEYSSSSSESSESDSDDEEEEDILQKHVKEVVGIWSQRSFVNQTDQQMQRHVTNFLLSGISLLSPQVDPSSTLVCSILEGVTFRLESAMSMIRRDGMAIAELLAKKLGHDLRFDELPDDERGCYDQDGPIENIPSNHNNMDKASNTDAGQSRSDMMKDERANDNHHPKNIHKENELLVNAGNQLFDPDADYVSDTDDDSSNGSSADVDENKEESCESNDDNDDDDSVWDVNYRFTAFDLDDDEEDLRESPRPIYLTECLALLRTPESEENALSNHKTALQDLPAIVRANPSDLPDLAAPLTLEVLRMENKFNLDGFSDLVISSAVAITVHEPNAVGHRLITELFGDSSGLSDRLNVLSVINQAAYELAGNKAIENFKKREALQAAEKMSKTGSIRKRGLIINDQDIFKRELASLKEAETEPRTRYWGRGRLKQKVAGNEFTIKNHFRTVAPIWFYSLLGKFVERKDDTTLWGGAIGCRLLSHFFITLSSIVECSGFTPGTDVLAKDLLDIVWSFRTVEVADVRMSVLLAVSISLSFLHENEVLNVLLDNSFGNLTQALRQISAEDPDIGCRQLALAISKNMEAALGTLQKGTLEFNL